MNLFKQKGKIQARVDSNGIVLRRLEARFDLVISLEECLKRVERKIDALGENVETSIDLNAGVAEVAAKALSESDKPVQ